MLTDGVTELRAKLRVSATQRLHSLATELKRPAQEDTSPLRRAPACALCAQALVVEARLGSEALAEYVRTVMADVEQLRSCPMQVRPRRTRRAEPPACCIFYMHLPALRYERTT
jgi:hypothetical protein